MKSAMDRQAERERELLNPNTQELQEPQWRSYGGKKRGANRPGGGGGFGKQAAPVLTAAEQDDALREAAVASDGVCYVPGVLSKDSASSLLACVLDELQKAYDAVALDPGSSVGRFNVPVETHDPLRGYLLLPLRDEQSVKDGVADGRIVQALRELIVPGSKLGELFYRTCGGDAAELYDLVALRTEAGAARQMIHYDTPFQKQPGLFCAFISLQDVTYSMGSTVFLPGTHVKSAQRRSFEDGLNDGKREAVLAQAASRYSMLKAGDAAFFDMRTLHAGTANLAAIDGGSQRLLFILTFRNRSAMRQRPVTPPSRKRRRNWVTSPT